MYLVAELGLAIGNGGEEKTFDSKRLVVGKVSQENLAEATRLDLMLLADAEVVGGLPKFAESVGMDSLGIWHN